MRFMDLMACIMTVEMRKAIDEFDEARLPLFRKVLIENGINNEQEENLNAFKEYMQLIKTFPDEIKKNEEISTKRALTAFKIEKEVINKIFPSNPGDKALIAFAMANPYIDNSKISRFDLLTHI